MYVKKMVIGLLGSCLSCLHFKLAEAVNAAVGAVVNGGRLTLSRLARSLKSVVAMRHRVKRIDRLLSNSALHKARLEIYRQVAARWLTGLDKVLILIDWSDATTNQRWHLLRASIAVEGRSVTLYEEVHPQRLYGNQGVHRRFLACLAKLLPAGCLPIIITDAGFHSTWFDLVTQRHWQWIGRIRGRDMVSITGGLWQSCKEIFQKATSKIQVFENAQYVRSHPTACRLVLSKRAPKKRHHHTRTGKHSRSCASIKAARSACEPWLLACSPGLAYLDGATIVAMYAKRMRIEQSFRDLKNDRLGLGFSDSRSDSANRLEILLLIAHLASWLMRLIGECAQQQQMQKYFQCAPCLKHKEISVLTLARRVIRAGEKWLEKICPENGIDIIHQQAQEAC
jgi:hypothetical protein